jgi:hypothetical protein
MIIYVDRSVRNRILIPIEADYESIKCVEVITTFDHQLLWRKLRVGKQILEAHYSKQDL